MINYISRTEDVKWLAYKLKNALDSKISINQYGLNQEVLHGYYDKEMCCRFDYFKLDFYVKYNRNYFLRIGVGENSFHKSYEEKLEALKDIGRVIIDTESITGKQFGYPLAFYKAVFEDSVVPTLEWAFKNQEEYTEALKNGTLFDDAFVENLIVNPKQKIK